ncbi:MAG TPA: hypothetical protein VHI99_29360 [Vicinamibacterales bacterium]|jgi:hypothetical protein|nr:hypothetical protein [Vicinamibacterales bacterium]
MGRMRRALTRVATGWLVCHICLLALTPSVPCKSLQPRTAEASCTCTHAEGPVCPMHRPSATADPQGCSCRGATDPPAIALASLIGPSAVLPTVVSTIVPITTPSTLMSAFAPSTNVALVPDAPPPRV